MQLAKGTENTEEKPVQKPEVSTDAPPTNFRFDRATERNENRKMKGGEGEGEGKEGMHKVMLL